MVRHDNLVRCLGLLVSGGLDSRAKLEQIIPELSRQVHGQVGQARLDVVAYEGTARLLIDAVGVSAWAGDDSLRRACSWRDGHAGRRAEIAKRTRYASPDLVPFAVETDGRLAGDARALLLKCAQYADEPERELQYLYWAVSSMVQDGVVRQLQPKPQ